MFQVEGDLKVAQENIDELTKQKHDIELNLNKSVKHMREIQNESIMTQIIELTYLLNSFRLHTEEIKEHNWLPKLKSW